jgi:hypothetical protein
MRKKTRQQRPLKLVSGTSVDPAVTSAPTTSAPDKPLPSVKEALSRLVTPDPTPTANSPTKLTKGADNGTAPAAKRNGAAPSNPPLSVPKPDVPFSLERFRTKHDVAAAGVETLVTALPHNRIAQAKDFVRLHHDKAYWSPEMCFVNVPVKGQKKDTLHLIDEELAMQFLPSGQVQRFRLVLAAKPYDIFFLCEVPSKNLDNLWNATNLEACEKAKTQWIIVSSRKDEGVDNYKITRARHPDAFPEPKWPTQSLTTLIERTFAGRIITTEDHPALLRLIGAKQSVS